MDIFALRREFMHRFDIPAPATPTIDPALMRMWETMLVEEWQEFQDALSGLKALDANASRHEQVTAMAEVTAEGVDVMNVLIGLLLSQGLPVEAMTRAIHEANLRKCQNGTIVRRADGKVLKPEGWQAADKSGIIRQALGEQEFSGKGLASPADDPIFDN